MPTILSVSGDVQEAIILHLSISDTGALADTCTLLKQQVLTITNTSWQRIERNSLRRIIRMIEDSDSGGNYKKRKHTVVIHDELSALLLRVVNTTGVKSALALVQSHPSPRFVQSIFSVAVSYGLSELILSMIISEAIDFRTPYRMLYKHASISVLADVWASVLFWDTLVSNINSTEEYTRDTTEDIDVSLAVPQIFILGCTPRLLSHSPQTDINCNEPTNPHDIGTMYGLQQCHEQTLRDVSAKTANWYTNQLPKFNLDGTMVSEHMLKSVSSALTTNESFLVAWEYGGEDAAYLLVMRVRTIPDDCELHFKYTCKLARHCAMLQRIVRGLVELGQT
ncbi:hypothetical protein SARC_10031 [Sphaeroforma arctica JP610]|uniref:Uncharacterized protein n=1 Tax=Sphaeroforma arctica JP610 TaxID=667725 RepID=A0A0L0FL53_9EUKA|nr:hypothetical protein SARC_10031 [Sphaeroforma arctica JP610]KNC77509.1 hypothetical protein SARC_10031 [Sphaeroforma arctica JP610]|eukprot:XP_014151411.1 hypothetical protein SARC_10031 [Sphaeroforma arctica JP610]